MQSVLTQASFTPAGQDAYEFDVSRTNQFDGLTKQTYAINEAVLAGVRGSRFNQALMRKRAISLALLLRCRSESDYYAQRKAILAACNKENGVGEFRFTTGGKQYLVYCVPEPPEVGWPSHPYFRVLLQFTAYDPVIYGATEQTEAGVQPPAGGGFIFEPEIAS